MEQLNTIYQLRHIQTDTFVVNVMETAVDYNHNCFSSHLNLEVK